MGSKEVRLNGQPMWAERYDMNRVSRVGNWDWFNSCYLLDSRALGVLVRRAAESIVTLRLDDAVELLQPPKPIVASDYGPFRQ
jgi:hypothetical protein